MQKHRQVNEKYLKRREQMPTMQMMEKLSEAEIDSLTTIKEKQVDLDNLERDHAEYSRQRKKKGN